jgi:hypothetical protein
VHIQLQAVLPLGISYQGMIWWPHGQ